MTTSVLTTFVRGAELTGHDLQVIKDYASDAPWEWRCALEGLVERARHDPDELIARIDVLEAAAKGVVIGVRAQLQRIQDLSEENKLTKGELKKACKVADQMLKNLNETVTGEE